MCRIVILACVGSALGMGFALLALVELSDFNTMHLIIAYFAGGSMGAVCAAVFYPFIAQSDNYETKKKLQHNSILQAPET